MKLLTCSNQKLLTTSHIDTYTEIKNYYSRCTFDRLGHITHIDGIPVPDVVIIDYLTIF